MSTDKSRRGLAMVAGAAIAWSVSGFFTRIIDTDVWTLLVWRGFSGAAFIAAWMLWKAPDAAVLAFRQMRGAAWSYALVSTFGMLNFIAAFKYTTVADVMIIYAAAPFFVAGAAWVWFGERTTVATLIAAAFALIGVAIMVGGARTTGNLTGDFLAFLMMLSVVSMTVIARKYQAIPMTAAACVSSLLSGLVSLPFAAPLSLSVGAMLSAILFGLIGMGIALSLYSEGARLAPASKVALVSTLETPLAPIWVWLAFNERPPTSTLIGGAIVLAAVVANLLWDTTRSEQSQAKSQ